MSKGDDPSRIQRPIRSGLSKELGAPPVGDVVSASPVGISVYDASGRCVMANQASADITGATLEQVRAQNFHDVESWKRSGLYDLALEALRTGTMRRQDLNTRSSFGKQVLIDCQLVPLGDGQLLLLMQDIADRMGAEMDARRYRRLLDEAEALAGLGSWELDVAAGKVTCSREMARLWSGEDSEAAVFERDDIMRVVHPEDLEALGVTVGRAMEAGAPFQHEFRMTVAGVGERRILARAVVELDEGGRPVFVRGTAQDVTEARRIESELLRRERLLDGIIDQNPYSLWLSDQGGTLLRTNRACRDLLGIRDEEVVGRYNVFEDNIVREQGMMPRVAAVFDRGETARFELEYDSANLEGLVLERTVARSLEVTIAPVKDDQGRITNAVVMHRDVTQERTAEDRLKRAKEYAERLVESANAMIIVLDAEGRIQVFNRAAEELTGYSRQELEGRDWFEVLVPKDRYPQVWEAFRKVPDEGMPASFENPIVTRSGEERHISWRNTVLHEGDQRVGTISFGVDITERRSLEEQLHHARRLEAIGQLAGGVAHDFNNMLSVILGHGELMRSGLSEGDPALEHLDEIEKAGRHARDVTRQLLAFSRRQIIAPRTVDLNALVARTVDTLATLVGEDITQAFFPCEDLWPVRVDPSQIDQILINLAVNARDAMPNGGKLTIETANVHFDEAYCATHVECPPGRYVLLAVGDDGVGMDTVTLEHVFEPFYTTKEVGQGTGLGLATVYGIVKQNGGFIDVYSEVGQGTVFKIYLPWCTDAVQGVTLPPDPPIAARSGTILLVEDEEQVRAMTASMLRRLGFSVVPAKGGQEALAYLEDDGAPLDLLVSDVVMPEMNGPQLHARVRALRPGTKVVFMSGYTENVVVRNGVLEEDVCFLQKPFSLPELGRVIREALGD